MQHTQARTRTHIPMGLYMCAHTYNMNTGAYVHILSLSMIKHRNRKYVSHLNSSIDTESFNL